MLRNGDGSDRTAADLFGAIENLMQDTVVVSDLREHLERLVATPPADTDLHRPTRRSGRMPGLLLVQVVTERRSKIVRVTGRRGAEPRVAERETANQRQPVTPETTKTRRRAFLSL